MNRSELMEYFKLQVDLYKHYLKMTIELNVFYYAITGALLSYYFSHRPDAGVKFSLVLPLVMSVFLALLFFYGARLNRVTREDVRKVCQALGTESVPEFAVLGWMLTGFATLMLVVAAGLLAILLGWLSGT